MTRLLPALLLVTLALAGLLVAIQPIHDAALVRAAERDPERAPHWLRLAWRPAATPGWQEALDRAAGPLVEVVPGAAEAKGRPAVAWSPEGLRLSVNNAARAATLWDGDAAMTLHTAADRISAAAFTPDGRGFALGDSDGTVHLIDEGPDRTWALGGEGVYDLAFSPDGRTLASAHAEGRFRLLSLDGGADRSFHVGAEVHAVAFSPDGAWLAWGGEGGDVWVAPAERPAQGRALGSHPGAVQDLAFSPDGALLASASRDGTVRLWSMPEGRLWKILAGHDEGVLSVHFSPDGTRLATGSGDHTAHVWDLRTYADPYVLRGHSRYVSGVAFHPDGERLATVSGDGTLRVQPADLDEGWAWRRFPHCLLEEDDLEEIDRLAWLVRWELKLCPLRVSAPAAAAPPR
ncbi:MAG: WD40 repeat domain-containing protein [Alphaproteobacteria bacterium]|nr:WD40 repeat domain-containing protein [Alphaproteobacteria bacterium]